MKRKWLIAGVLIFAEIALCGLIIGAFWSGVSLLNLDRLRFRIGSDTVTATADEQNSYDVTSPITLNVNKGTDYFAYGDVTVVGGTGSQLVVKAHKTAWDVDTASAQADLADLQVVVTQNGNTWNVSVPRPDVPVIAVGVSRPGTVDFTIEVPAKTSVYLVTNAGNISVSNIAGSQVLAHSTFGTVNLSDVTGDSVDVRSNSGEITLKNVTSTGPLDVHTDFGGITFSDGSGMTLSADTNSGEITLQSIDLKGSATVKSDFGSITLTDVAASAYDVQSNSGGITVDGAEGEVKLHTDFGDLTLSNAKLAQLDLSTNSGTITFAGSLGKGPHKVETDFGTVAMSLPADSELSVDLSTDMGRIKSDLPITISGDQDNTHWKGSLNGGGAALNVKTNSGDITLETLKP